MSSYRPSVRLKRERRRGPASKQATFVTIERIDGEGNARWEAILWSPDVVKVASGRGSSKVAALLAAMDSNGEHARR